ncbi:MAG: cellulase family glycosylhydrolase [Chloroflexi bacterium]|nr:cellulase family glycosylhydrolase [Chloroflexota bacterium]
MAAPLLREALRQNTGEEELGEQLKGTIALLLLVATRPELETAPQVPMAHTSQNPYAVNTFLEQEVEQAKLQRSLAMIRQAGFQWIRQQFSWEDIEIHAKGDFTDRRHAPPRSSWEKYDAIVEGARARGLGIIARLDQPPAWAAPRAEGVIQAPPSHLEDFGDFVYALASRYRGRIRYYQIWNEPNLRVEWGGPADPTAYTQLLCIAYRRIKEADPQALVLSAALSPTLEEGPDNLGDLIYLEGMYRAGAGACFDILGAQAFGLWTGPTDRRVDPSRTNFSRPLLLREIMVRHGDAEKPIWISEFGWNALPLELPAPPIFGRVDEARQAEYAVGAYQRAQREWPWMGVMSYWFFKRADDRERDQPFYFFRLVDPDFTPRPVYRAVQEWATGPAVLGPGYKQEDHWALTYQGEWRSTDDPRAQLGSYRESREAGASLSFIFGGTDLGLVVGRGPDGGRLQVAIDEGRPTVTVDLNAPSVEYGIEVPVAAGLSEGAHAVRINVELDAGQRVALDAIHVEHRSNLSAAAILAGTTLTLSFVAWGLIVHRGGLKVDAHSG